MNYLIWTLCIIIIYVIFIALCTGCSIDLCPHLVALPSPRQGRFQRALAPRERRKEGDKIKQERKKGQQRVEHMVIIQLTWGCRVDWSQIVFVFTSFAFFWYFVDRGAFIKNIWIIKHIPGMLSPVRFDIPSPLVSFRIRLLVVLIRHCATLNAPPHSESCKRPCLPDTQTYNVIPSFGKSPED